MIKLISIVCIVLAIVGIALALYVYYAIIPSSFLAFAIVWLFTIPLASRLDGHTPHAMVGGFILFCALMADTVLLKPLK